MSKKIRKKKEVEAETYNILQLDEKIRRLIVDETKKLDQYKTRLDEVNVYLDKSARITYRARKDLVSEKITLDKKIADIESENMFAEYICVSQNIITEYMALIIVPQNVSFFGGGRVKVCPDNNKKELLLERFLDVARHYLPIKTYRPEIQTRHSCSCGNTLYFSATENVITCDLCGIEKSIYTIQTNFKDVDRVNLSQKYKYNKRVHFRDTINQYQGKQNKKIDVSVYSQCDIWFEKHNLLLPGDTFHKIHQRITKEHIDMALSETGNTSNYEDVNLIHNYFTGIACPDLSLIESELFDDFDRVVAAYETIKDIDRTNFLNGQYVLYQLLKWRGVRVRESDFHKLKTRDRLLEHDTIWSLISIILEKNYSPSC